MWQNTFRRRKKPPTVHHHERLAKQVKKLETRIGRLEKHQHRNQHGVFTDEPWLPQEGNTHG
jgi:hypothetical protein